MMRMMKNKKLSYSAGIEGTFKCLKRILCVSDLIKKVRRRTRIVAWKRKKKSYEYIKIIFYSFHVLNSFFFIWKVVNFSSSELYNFLSIFLFCLLCLTYHFQWRCLFNVLLCIDRILSSTFFSPVPSTQFWNENSVYPIFHLSLYAPIKVLLLILFNETWRNHINIINKIIVCISRLFKSLLICFSKLTRQNSILIVLS